MNENHWSENVILADADYIDRVAFDLTVNFERMLERRIPQADLARWAECIALDGGLREGSQQQTHVILLHSSKSMALQNFAPGHYAHDIMGQAFQSPLGEFTLSAITPPEDLTTKERLFTDVLQMVGAQSDVHRLMVIPDEAQYGKVAQSVRQLNRTDLRVTLFAMQPMQGGPFCQEILGYSIMSALGIKSSELHPDTV